MSDVKVKYDPQVDVLRIRFGSTAIEESEQIEPGIIIDYDDQGNVVGVEILDASERINRTQDASEQA